VYLGTKRSIDKTVAVKLIKKSKVSEADVYYDLMMQELDVLEKTVHPNITTIHELLHDKRNYYIIMECLTGGNLLDRVINL